MSETASSEVTTATPPVDPEVERFVASFFYPGCDAAALRRLAVATVAERRKTEAQLEAEHAKWRGARARDSIPHYSEAALAAALAAREAARAEEAEAERQHVRAQSDLADAKARKDRCASNFEAWTQRLTRRRLKAIAMKKPAPCEPADAKAALERDTAEANFIAAQKADEDLGEALAAKRAKRVAAEDAFVSNKRAAHRVTAAKLLARMKALLDGVLDIRAELGATAVAGELFGLDASFCGALSPEQVDLLNSPPLPPQPTLADLFMGHAVGINTSPSAAPGLLEKHLARWRERDERLERGDV